MCIAVGKVSLLDWPRLTWSLGCTGDFEPISPPAISMARFAMTSLAFMFDCVPEPVCQTTSGKWSSRSPAITSSAARCTSREISSSSSPSSLVRPGTGPLHQPERLDDGTTPDEAVAPDREVPDAALGLGAPVAVGGDVDATHGVGLGAGLGGHAATVSAVRSAAWGRTSNVTGPDRSSTGPSRRGTSRPSGRSTGRCSAGRSATGPSCRSRPASAVRSPVPPATSRPRTHPG